MEDLIERDKAIDAIWDGTNYDIYTSEVKEILEELPSAQPEITDEQAIEHLRDTGWMQNHDHEMYMMGIRDALADDSGSYDALIPAEQKVGRWIRHKNKDGEYYGYDCSACGEWYVMPYGKTKYCPNCGAKMEGRDED